MGAAGHGKERCLPTPCLNGGRCAIAAVGAEPGDGRWGR
eukprot:COSAG04_NODE_23229_length_342_cov_0.333333_1_plen_38_part_01